MPRRYGRRHHRIRQRSSPGRRRRPPSSPRGSGRISGNHHRPKRYDRRLLNAFYLAAQSAILPAKPRLLPTQTHRRQKPQTSSPILGQTATQRPAGHAPRQHPLPPTQRQWRLTLTTANPRTAPPSPRPLGPPILLICPMSPQQSLPRIASPRYRLTQWRDSGAT